MASSRKTGGRRKAVRPATRSGTPRRATATRSSTTRARSSTGTRRRTTTRRRTSTASTLGTAVGAALAGLIAALLGGLAWWGWVLLIVGGLLLGLGYAILRARRVAAQDEPPPEPSEPGAAAAA